MVDRSGEFDQEDFGDKAEEGVNLFLATVGSSVREIAYVAKAKVIRLYTPVIP